MHSMAAHLESRQSASRDQGSAANDQKYRTAYGFTPFALRLPHSSVA